LFIGAVTALLLVLFLGITLLRFQATMLPQVMDRLPEIEISQGQVSIHNGPEGPIQLEHDGGLIVIDIDRSEEEFRKTPDLLMGVGRDFIIMQTREGLKTAPIDDDKNFVFNRQMISEFFSSGFHILLLPMIFPFVAFGQFLYFLLYMVAISLMSYLVTAFLREEYDF